MRISILSGMLRLGIGLIFAFTTFGCEDNITVEVPPQQGVNKPPKFIMQGPEYPSGKIEFVGSEYQIREAGPTFFVLVVDENGLDDIAAVFLNVDSILVQRVIARPDSSRTTCAAPSYADLDTFDVMPYIPISSLPGIINRPMSRQSTGFYAFGGFAFGALTYNNFRSQGLWAWDPSGVIGPPVKCCTCGPVSLEHFGVYPPAVPSPEDILITYVEFEFRGISITAYDAGALSATTTFPDLRLIYAMTEEQNAAP